MSSISSVLYPAQIMARNTEGSSLGVIIILNTDVSTGPLRSSSRPVSTLRMLLSPTPPKSTSFTPLESFIVSRIPVTRSSSVTLGTRVRSTTRKGIIFSCSRLPFRLSCVFIPTSLPSSIHPEVVMVASVRVRSFSATGMDEKGYCLVLLLWAAGRTPYSSASLRL